MRWKEFLMALGPKGHLVLVAVLAIPFMLFLPLPGLSMLFGVIIAISGVRMAMRRHLRLPKRLEEREVTTATLSKILRHGVVWAVRIEKVIRPRGRFAASPKHGWAIALAGVALALPLPPGTNFLPGVAAFLLALGALEGDSVAVAFGYSALLADLLFLVVIPLVLLG
jgi:hypothetical protein